MGQARSWIRVLSWLLMWGAAGGLQAETVSTASISAELRSLAAAAHVIFVGQIVSIQRHPGLVEVRFRVEQPVAGAPAAMYTMREWAGTWPPGTQRYAVGQRVLAFLHGASGSGFSSPVHGAEGLVPVVVQGADAPALLDVRRVAAFVVRTPRTALPTEADGAVPLADVLRWVRAGTAGAPFRPSRVSLPTHGNASVQVLSGAGPVDPGKHTWGHGTAVQPAPEPVSERAQ